MNARTKNQLELFSFIWITNYVNMQVCESEIFGKYSVLFHLNFSPFYVPWNNAKLYKYEWYFTLSETI